jgi:fructokinase
VETVPAIRVKVVDATGAGDGFVAGLLSRLGESFKAGLGIEALRDETVHEAVEKGCRVGAAVVTRLGAVAGLPHAKDL